MANDLNIGIRLKADGSGLVGEVRVTKKELDKLRDAVDKTGKAGKTAGAGLNKMGDEAATASIKTQNLNKAARDASGGFGQLKAAAASLGLGLAIRDAAGLTLEMDKNARSLKFATGGAKESAAANRLIREESERLGLVFNQQVGLYGKLGAAARGTALEGHGVHQTWLAMAEASTVLGLSQEQTTGAMRALEQMISKGNVQAEELRGQLGERLPGAFQIAARAVNKTTKELNKMLEDGQVIAEDFLPKFAAQIRKEMGPELADAINSPRAELSRFINVLDDAKLAFGTGFLDGFVQGLSGAGSEVVELNDVLMGLGDTLGSVAAFAGDNANTIEALVASYIVYKVATSNAVAATMGFIASSKVAAATTRGQATAATQAHYAAMGLAGGSKVATAAIGTQATAVRGLTIAYRGLSAAMGGPFGLAMTALTAGYFLLGDAFEDTNKEMEEYETRSEKIQQLSDQLTVSTEKEAEALREKLRVLREEQRHALASNLAELEIRKAGLDERTPRGRQGALRPLNAEIAAIKKALVDLDKQTEESAKKIDEEIARINADQLKKITKEYYSLAASLDPAIAAQQKHAEATATLDEALKAGLIPDMQEYHRLLALVNEQLPTVAGFMERVNAAVQDETSLLELSNEEREVERQVRSWINESKRLGLELTEEEIAQLRELSKEQREAKRAAEDRVKAEKDAAKKLEDVQKNYIEAVQGALATFFEGMIDGQIDSLGDFWDAYTDLGKKAIAETLAAQVMGGEGGLGSIFSADGPLNTGDFLSGQVKGLGDTMKPLLEPLKDMTGSLGDITGTLGNALNGAGLGTTISGFLGGSETGAQIGGAVGSLVPVPGGSIIGSVVGGLVGDLFGKTEKAAERTKTDSRGNLVQYDLASRGGADTDAVSQVSDAFIESLESIRDALDAEFAADFEIGGIGTRKGKYGFDEDYDRIKKFSGPDEATYDDPSLAILDGIESSIERGLLEGLDPVVEAILKGTFTTTKNGKTVNYQDLSIEERLDEAVFVQEFFQSIEDGLLAIEEAKDPMAAAFDDLADIHAERLELSAQYEADMTKTLRLNAEERQQLVDHYSEQVTAAFRGMVADIDSFVKDTQFGSSSQLSAADQLSAAEEQFNILVAKAREGDEAAMSEVVDAARDVMDLSKEVFASSDQYFEREGFLVDTLESLKNIDPTADLDRYIQSYDERVAVSLEGLGEEVVEGNRAAIEEAQLTNNYLQQILTTLQNQPASSAPRTPITVNGGGLAA